VTSNYVFITGTHP